jgi:hypothetical protein
VHSNVMDKLFSFVRHLRKRGLTWCGYEVPGMVSLRDLKGDTRLDRSKDMSVHVSTCTSYDLNALAPVVWKLWR